MSDGTPTATATSATPDTGSAAPSSIMGSDGIAAPAAATTTDPKVDTKATTTEAKPVDPKAADSKAAETPPPPGLVDDKWAPKAVEGIVRSEKVFGEARTLFSKLKLNTEQAQALVEFSDAQSKAVAAEAKTVDEGWVKEIEGDKDLGGAKLNQTRESVRTLLRGLKSGPALSKWLDGMGIPNAAPLVRAFAEIASRTGEDKVKSTVVDAASASFDENERRFSRTYGNSRKES